MKFFSQLLDLLFPPRCVFCGKILNTYNHGICNNCEKTLPRTKNGGAHNGDFFTICVSPLVYTGNVRKSMLKYKFKDEKGYSRAYGRLLADCIRENLTERYDIITWVPLSEKRLKKRGYDQAMLLAMAACNYLEDVPVELLKKHTEIPAQSSVAGVEKRRANVSGVYTVTDEYLIRGKRILLIDDITTTGATLSECARTLRLFGAADVVCATLAKAGA